MTKVVALLLIVFLALAAVTGYVVLRIKINAGEMQVDEGQLAVVAGTAKMQAGKQKLSDGQNDYARAKQTPFLVWADKLLNGGRGFRNARRQLAEGQDAVDAGVIRLAEGELAMERGKTQLRMAKGVHVAGALGAVILVPLSIWLGFRWRRSLARLHSGNITNQQNRSRPRPMKPGMKPKTDY